MEESGLVCVSLLRRNDGIVWTKHRDIPGVEVRLETSGSDAGGTPSAPRIGLIVPEETSPMEPGS